MFKRLFLAGTITFPLYLLFMLDGATTSSAVVESKLVNKAGVVVREIKSEVSQLHQDFKKLTATSESAKTFFNP